MKQCTKCKDIKRLAEFGVARGNKDGLNYWCKVCVRAASAAWKVANPDGVKRHQARYRAEHKDAARVYAAAYYAEHKEQWRSYAKAYREANREVTNARIAAWTKANPQKNRANVARRKARKLGNGYEVYDRFAIYERDKGVCHICHRKVSRSAFTLDHLVPLVHGGPDTAANVAVAHSTCNKRRGPGRTPAQLRLVG